MVVFRLAAPLPSERNRIIRWQSPARSCKKKRTDERARRPSGWLAGVAVGDFLIFLYCPPTRKLSLIHI